MDFQDNWQLIGGTLCAVIALVSWLGDWRRMRRRDIDRVGFMPWAALFFWSLLGAVMLLGLAARSWIAGG